MKGKRNLFIISFLIVGLGFMRGVSQSQIEEKALKIIHNGVKKAWGDRVRVKLEHIRTIGGLDEADPNLAFGAPYDVVMDSVKNIYVLDMKNGCLRKISPEGKYLQTIGRPGQGPEEFQAVFSVDIDDEDNLYIGDMGNMRVQVLSRDGRYLRKFKLRERSSHLIRYISSNLIAEGGSFTYGKIMKNPEKLPALIDIMDPEGRPIKSYGEAADFKDALVNSIINNFHFISDGEGNIFTSFVYQNRIEKYDRDGNLVWRADRPLNYTTEVIDKGRVHITDEGTAYEAPRINTVSMGIAVDGKGRIWVNTNSSQMKREGQRTMRSAEAGGRESSDRDIKNESVQKLEIFNADGTLLGEIALAHPAHGIRIFGDSLIIWERINAAVYQYKITDIS